MSSIEMCAPCLFGLEGVLADELRKIDAQNVRPENGRVLFSGNSSILARANLWLRTAERVEIVVGSFKAQSFEELFEGTRKLDWERWIDKKDAFPVKGWSLNSKLFSIPDCQSIIKKAVVRKLSEKHKIEWFEESGPIHQIRFSILKDVVTLMLDTTGVGLHKRGYRALSLEAPIKETLSSAMVMLSRPYPDSTLYDPFCGSGTILIEAALHAKNIAPSMKRRFSCEQWAAISTAPFRDERERARSLEKRDVPFRAIGTDIDPNAVKMTLDNAKKAGVDDCVFASQADICDFAPTTERGIIVTNPPYGERILDVQEARNIYKTMGNVFEQKRGYRYSVISPDEQFEDFFGRNADKKRKLYNGMIKCNLYMYFK